MTPGWNHQWLPRSPPRRDGVAGLLCTDSHAASRHGLICPAHAAVPAREGACERRVWREAFLALSQTGGGGSQILLALS